MDDSRDTVSSDQGQEQQVTTAAEVDNKPVTTGDQSISESAVIASPESAKVFQDNNDENNITTSPSTDEEDPSGEYSSNKSSDNGIVNINDRSSTDYLDDQKQQLDKIKDIETTTEGTVESAGEEKASAATTTQPIVSSSKKSRPPYKYNPDKITLRFLFANRDGLTVTTECNPSDTVGEVKAALLSVWPEGMPVCDSSCSDSLRLICMGRGYLMPDTRTLEDCQVPVFRTHPTPINVSIKPGASLVPSDSTNNGKKRKDKDGSANGNTSSNGIGSNSQGGIATSASSASGQAQVSQGCHCVIL